ncbi:MAG TPA: hypothetical protein VFC07_00870 [Verrucomicrobiae bacterium]|nr:hypothetical protein [Verrucomicrobiae bacterium]
MGASVSLAWDEEAVAVGGYDLFYGIASGQYDWMAAAGGNTQITLTNLPGGFTYYFSVKAYSLSFIPGRRIPVESFSGPSNEISWTAPCPLNAPQIVVTNGTWVIACRVSMPGMLQSSTDLVHWVNLYAVNPPCVNMFTGVCSSKQFFRLKLN